MALRKPDWVLGLAGTWQAEGQPDIFVKTDGDPTRYQLSKTGNVLTAPRRDLESLLEKFDYAMTATFS